MAIKSFTRSTIENNIFYRSMLAGNTAFEPSSEDILAEEVLTSAAATVTFSSLVSSYGSDYQHFQIRGVVRDTNTSFALRNGLMQFNSDTTSYRTHLLEGNGSSVSSSEIATSTSGYFAIYTGSATTTIFSPFVADILDPFDTNKNTTVRVLSGVAGSNIVLRSFAYFDTQAIDSISMTATGVSWSIGSRFTLIGLK